MNLENRNPRTESRIQEKINRIKKHRDRVNPSGIVNFGEGWSPEERCNKKDDNNK